MNSIEKIVIPRYQVLEVLKLKMLLKKNPCLLSLIKLHEDEFLEKYISKFSDNAEELLIAYNGELLNSLEYSVFIDVLRLFAHGTWSYYKITAHTGSLLTLVPNQVRELRQLSVLTFVEADKVRLGSNGKKRQRMQLSYRETKLKRYQD